LEYDSQNKFHWVVASVHTLLGVNILVETVLATFPSAVEEGCKMQIEYLSSFLWWFTYRCSPNPLPQFQTCTRTGILQYKFQFVQPRSRFGMSQYNITLHDRKQESVPPECDV